MIVAKGEGTMRETGVEKRQMIDNSRLHLPTKKPHTLITRSESPYAIMVPYTSLDSLGNTTPFCVFQAPPLLLVT